MGKSNFKLSFKEVQEKISNSNTDFIEFFNDGDLSVESYKPDKIDNQTPHPRDEIYIVASGEGTFYCDGKREKFGTGDFLFVPAGVDHRFENFSSDFVTWVIFYGPEKGESLGDK
jgi:mannose-6-phosphate isomerase-like protein (cupin superfamily)